jgi:hypothetical protein
MRATAETNLDSTRGPGTETGGTTNITTTARDNSQRPTLNFETRANSFGPLGVGGWELAIVELGVTRCGTMMPLENMAPKRAAAYIGVAAILLAWLASAAGVAWRSTAPDAEQPRAVQTSGTEGLAADVQAQAVRLRERIAAAPVPTSPLRNPFTFAPKEDPRQRPAPPSPAAALTRATDVPDLSEPPLSLIGVAEQQSPEGIVRTAILSTDSDELFMLTEGDVLGARYRVRRIEADAVELIDLVTNSIRRLTLR